MVRILEQGLIFPENGRSLVEYRLSLLGSVDLEDGGHRRGIGLLNHLQELLLELVGHVDGSFVLLVLDGGICATFQQSLHDLLVVGAGLGFPHLDGLMQGSVSIVNYFLIGVRTQLQQGLHYFLPALLDGGDQGDAVGHGLLA